MWGTGATKANIRHSALSAGLVIQVKRNDPSSTERNNALTDNDV